MKKPKVTVGIISFKDQKYLKHGLPSLLSQNYSHFEILVCDNNNDPENEIANWIKTEFPTITVVNAGGNVGFGNAHNYMIDHAIKNESKYYFAFNSDMFADENLINNLVERAESDEKIAAISPKIFTWSSFPEKPTLKNDRYIDSTGMIAKASHHFLERGAGEEDHGQYNNPEGIWGASGAAPFFSISALQDTKHNPGEYFDKNFFMYKEDIDMMYRLRWAGYKVFYEPTALVWHDRTAADPGGIIANIKARKSRGTYIKEHSFLNHLQFLYKNFSPHYSFLTKLKTAFFLAKYFAYLLIFDRQILKQYKKFQQLKPNLLIKKATMPQRILTEKMEKWFI